MRSELFKYALRREHFPGQFVIRSSVLTIISILNSSEMIVDTAVVV